MTQCVHFSSKREFKMNIFLIFSCFLSKQTVFLENVSVKKGGGSPYSISEKGGSISSTENKPRSIGALRIE